MLKQLCAGRLVFGGGAIVAPALFGGPWVGKDAGRAGVAVFSRAFGIRDVAIGIGTFSAMRRGSGDLRTWLVLGLACDVVDLGATIAERDRLPAMAVPMLAVLAGSAIVTQTLNLAAGEEQPPA